MKLTIFSLFFIIFFIQFINATPNRWVIEADNIEIAKSIANKYNLKVNERYFKSLEGIYLLESEANNQNKEMEQEMLNKITKSLEQDKQVKSVEYQQQKRLYTRKVRGDYEYNEWMKNTFHNSKINVKRAYYVTDPNFKDQWHLLNTGQTGGPVGIDINVYGAWNVSRVSGDNVTIAIVDDGLQYDHPDLEDNYDHSLGRNFQGFPGDENDPYPLVSDDYHGTSCAGIASASSNEIYGVGVAFKSKLVGIRLIGQNEVTDADVAEALSHSNNQIDIYSNSYGPLDNGLGLTYLTNTIYNAMLQSIKKGRNGLGNIYIFQTGNGDQYLDNCNYDAFANNPLSITVGSISNFGVKTYYSEPCAALLCVAVSSQNVGILTTDLLGSDGFSPLNITNQFGGTSASVPMVAGVVSLMLEANPKLNWKEVQAILIKTSKKIDATDKDWVKNGGGYNVNHKYGFGLIDASAAVEMAQKWKEKTYLKTITTYKSTKVETNKNPNNFFLSKIDVELNVKVEHIQVIFSTDYLIGGDLKVVLTSPFGTQSVLSDYHGITNVVGVQLVSPTNFSSSSVSGVLASFGPTLTSNMTSGLFVFADPIDGCSQLKNFQQVIGKVVVIKRGTCLFINKVLNAQNAGATGVIVINNVGGNPIRMGGANSIVITIPSLMISLDDGNSLEAAYNATNNVTGYLFGTFVPVVVIENFDNWPFASLRHWGESSKGTWSLSVSKVGNRTANSTTLSYKWDLLIYYSSNDSDRSVKLGVGLGVGLGVPLLIIIFFVIYKTVVKNSHQRFDED